MEFKFIIKSLLVGLLVANFLIINVLAVDTIQNTIIILIDGSRADGLYNHNGTNIKNLLNHGVKSEKSLSTFPTITPSAHSSIFTGDYPYQHGIPGFRWFNRDLK